MIKFSDIRTGLARSKFLSIPPSGYLTTFLACLTPSMLAPWLWDISRFYRGGGLLLDEWEEQWFSIICEPYFSYIPCALSSSDEVAYRRLAWIQDDVLTL
jgi:hypothetical protein